MPKLWHLLSHSSQVVEHSGYGWQRLLCEHQPHPLSSVQPQTLGAAAHVSMHLRRHDERHVLCEGGHSRHVVVHWSAGAQVPVELHQPHPGARAAHEQMSDARPHAAADEMFTARPAPPNIACCADAAASSVENKPSGTIIFVILPAEA